MTSSKNINKGKSFKEAKEDKNERYQTMKEKLKTDYDVDVLEDVLLAQPDKIILFADLSDPESIEMEVVAGSLERIGFEDKPSIKLDELLSYFEYNCGMPRLPAKNLITTIYAMRCMTLTNNPTSRFRSIMTRGSTGFGLTLSPCRTKNTWQRFSLPM